MTPHCCFCGGDEPRCIRSPLVPSLAICILCLRRGIRALGEVPDPTDGVIDLASRRRSPAPVFGG